ncbi:4-alpha-glucanotransferase [Thorsellia kenyensis]|uniref:4-alpha-glucanotransferase n=1 Tax=Thorsellia kenyensis TaxID=1549888 RepID=UPI00406C66F2
MPLDDIKNNAMRAGIGLSYHNAFGQNQEINEFTLTKLLSALNTEAANSIQPLNYLEPVYIGYVGNHEQITVNIEGDFQWQIILENGEIFAHGQQNWKTLDIPCTLELGYHSLKIHSLDDNKTETASIIITPHRCFEQNELVSNKKLWGVCVQLYTLKSESYWGVGDFGCLKQLIHQIASKGGAYIGLNPLHSLFPANPESASPYAPSSRKWINVIYIDVDNVEDFKNNPQAQKWFNDSTIQSILAEARNAEYVNYTQVQYLKKEALKIAFEQFLTRAEDCPSKKSFQEFKKKGGQSLYQQAAFDALHEKLSANDIMQWGWPVWDKQYSDFHQPAVQAFCLGHTQSIDFYTWLQWLAFTQLDECYEVCKDLNMPIGLYRDLAVGVGEGGAEIWGDKALYCLDASVGAPPDILGPQGQNWGLPPMHPKVLYNRAYQPFIDLLRANMQSCGALRMDHVMGLLRLWWIPYGETADKGAYMHFNVDHFLAIIALESHRNQCMVIGEDLGTVPPEIVDKLHYKGVYSYKVVYFENNNNYFIDPEHYKQQAIATITTHDLPTLSGYWSKYDFDLGKEVGVYKNEDVLHQLSEDRNHKKQGLLDALHRKGCFDTHFTGNAMEADMSLSLNKAIHKFTALTNAALIGLQPEDWILTKTPVNIPGTSEEYPNWRRKLGCTIEEMFTNREVHEVIDVVNTIRPR